MKNLVLFMFIISGSVSLIGQTTPVPDPNFEAELIALGIDTNGMNGNILNSDAAGVLNLNVSNAMISNLAGIEAFVDLTLLDVQDNELSNLSLISNTNLVVVDCQNNNITSLNLSGNAVMTSLQASNNDLTTIDLSNNAALSDISLQGNELTSLDVSANPNIYQIIAHDNDLTSITLPASPTLLEIVWVYNNNLVSVDLTSAPSLATLRFENNELTFLDLRNGNNGNIHTMDARNNPNLDFICVDDVAYAQGAANWNKDATAVYSETCALGIGENDLNLISVYPNPIDGLLHLDVYDPTTINNISISDISGKQIRLNVTSEIDLAAFSAGIYFLTVELVSGERQTVKVVKR